MAQSGRAKVKGRKGKIGRNKNRIANYYNSGRYLWNKARKIVHHMRRYGEGDGSANNALKVIKAAMSLGDSRKFEKQYQY